MNSRGSSLLLVILGVVLVIGIIAGAYYLNGFSFPKSSYQSPLSQSNESLQKQFPKENEVDNFRKDIIQTAKQFNFHQPTKYLYNSSNGDLVLANLNSEEEFIIVKANGQWGRTEQVTVSPNGRYLTFLTLPKEIVESYTKNPPSEFFGSEYYELWIADIASPQKPVLIKIQSKLEYTVNQDPVVVGWDDNEGFYFHTKDRGINNNTNENYYFTISDGQTSKINSDKDILDNDLTSPNNSEYILPNQKSTLTADKWVYNRTYTLDLYKKDRLTPERTLLKKDFSTKIVNSEGKTFIFDEGYTNNTFLTNNHILYNHIVNQDGKYFYINLESVNTQGEVLVIDSKPFIANGTYGFSNYTYSPKGNYLVALASEIKTNDKTANQIFVYNPSTQEKRYLATRSHCLKNYYWYSETEIIVNIDKHCSSNEDSSVNSTKPFVLNVETGREAVFSKLNNKDPLTVF